MSPEILQTRYWSLALRRGRMAVNEPAFTLLGYFMIHQPGSSAVKKRNFYLKLNFKPAHWERSKMRRRLGQMSAE